MNSSVITKLKNYSKSKLALWAVGIVFLALAFTFSNWNKNKLIQSDVVVYYQYLTAAFQFQDLSFEFAYELPEDFDGEIWITRTEEGIHNKVTMGYAIMLTPFYLMASGINELFGLGSYGYSSLFQFFIFLAGFTYGLLGLILIRKVLLALFNDTVVAVTLLIIGLGTNLTYYSVLCPGMTHVYSFFLFSLVLWLTVEWHKKPKFTYTMLLGITLGVITLVRPSNALVVLIPLLVGVTNHGGSRELLQYYLVRFKHFLLMAGFTFLVVSLQMMFWKYSSGSWLVYSYGEERFFWTDPKIIDGLFSGRKGWLLYTPLMSLALIGFFIKNKNARLFRVALMVFFLINIYVILSWWCWWYGGGFGLRPLVESYAVLAVMVAAAVYFFMKNKLRTRLFLPAVALLIGLNLFQTWQFEKGLIHYDGMTIKAYQKLFLKTHNPHDIFNYIKSPDYEAAKKGNR